MRIGLSRVVALVAALLVLGAATGCGEKSEEAATNPPEPAGFKIEGRWSGELNQKALKSFRIDATIGSLDNPKQNTVHYTGIDCSGNWTFQGRQETAYRFREVIDRGTSKTCKGVGTVTMTPVSADRADYEFRGGGVESQGVLSRGGSGGQPTVAKKSKSNTKQGNDHKQKKSSGSNDAKQESGSSKPSKKDIGVGSDQDIPDTSCSYTGDC
jgi:hypothetical protein